MVVDANHNHISCKSSLISNLDTFKKETQPTFTCSNFTIETLELGVKYVLS